VVSQLTTEVGVYGLRLNPARVTGGSFYVLKKPPKSLNRFQGQTPLLEGVFFLWQPLKLLFFPLMVPAIVFDNIAAGFPAVFTAQLFWQSQNGLAAIII
jgi:hypothetical protein